jgi:hypothetical protein
MFNCKTMLSTMSRYLGLLLVVILTSNSVYGQQENAAVVETASLELIDLPVAGILNHGDYGIGLRNYPNGGVLGEFSIGVFNRMLGILYYGGENLIGEGEVNWNPQVGFDIRLRIIDENLIFPGIAVGINTQGYGGFVDQTDRYTIKSKGFYVVSSRNYSAPMMDIGIHAGANISLERDDNDKDLNFFGGTNVSIKNRGELLLEYDFAINDNEELSQGSNNGYLNAGIRFFISRNFHLTFQFKNLLKNTVSNADFGRAIRIEYRNSFINAFR